MQLKRSKRPAWEYVVVTAVVALAMGMALALTARRDRLFKERLLILELQTLRNLSAAYRMEYKDTAKGLEVIPAQAGIQWNLLDPRFRGDDNQKSRAFFSDPFGHPYHYDRRNSWISSSSPGYESW